MGGYAGWGGGCGCGRGEIFWGGSGRSVMGDRGVSCHAGGGLRVIIVCHAVV